MKPDAKLDCFGLICPMSIIQTAKKMKALRVGQMLEVASTDEDISGDIPAWCKMTGQEYLGLEKHGDFYRVFIRNLKE